MAAGSSSMRYIDAGSLRAEDGLDVATTVEPTLARSINSGSRVRPSETQISATSDVCTHAQFGAERSAWKAQAG
jgi:hypothetical protein